jgi:hypothetical protein
MPRSRRLSRLAERRAAGFPLRTVSVSRLAVMAAMPRSRRFSRLAERRPCRLSAQDRFPYRDSP